MRSLIFAALLAVIPLLSWAAGPVFNEAFMQGCIKGGIDAAGPGNASVIRITKRCTCMAVALNRTVSEAEFKAAVVGDSSSVDKKIKAIGLDCAAKEIAKAAAPVPAPPPAPTPAPAPAPAAEPLFGDASVNQCIQAAIDEGIKTSGPEIVSVIGARVTKMCLCFQVEANRTITAEDLVRSTKGSYKPFNEKLAAAYAKCSKI